MAGGIQKALYKSVIANYSLRKATLVTTLFAVLGVASLIIHRTNTRVDWLLALPLIIFYATLCINTFFSVRLFSSLIPPDDIAHNVIDLVLAILYATLAWFLYDRNLFIFIAGLMFAGATIKYSYALKNIPYKELLRKKIFIDNIGTFISIITYAASIFVHPSLFLWIWSIGFLITNIYILYIKPLYTLDQA